jgi:hypothetical protein
MEKGSCPQVQLLESGKQGSWTYLTDEELNDGSASIVTPGTGHSSHERQLYTYVQVSRQYIHGEGVSNVPLSARHDDSHKRGRRSMTGMSKG